MCFGVITACLISLSAGSYIEHWGFRLPGFVVVQASFLVLVSLTVNLPKAITGVGSSLLLVVSLGLLYVVLSGEGVQSKRDDGIK